MAALSTCPTLINFYNHNDSYINNLITNKMLISYVNTIISFILIAFYVFK